MFENVTVCTARNSDIADELGCGPVTQQWYAQKLNADGRAAFVVPDAAGESYLMTGEQAALTETLWEQVELPATTYVDPAGTKAGAGTELSPVDMSTAFTALSLVAAGSQINVNAGVYTGDYSFQHNGTALARTTVTFAPGAKIKGSLVVYGQYVDIYYPVCYSEPIARETEETGSNPTIREVDGIKVLSAHSRIIHPMIYDKIANGVTNWQASSDATLYGAWILNNGWTALDRGHGHGCYTQNDTDTKTIELVTFAQGYSGGLRAYTESQSVIGFRINKCISVRDEMLIGGHSPASDIVIDGNKIYGAYLEVGETDRDNDDVQIINNYVVSGENSGALILRWWKDITITGNTFILDPNMTHFLDWSIHPNPTSITIDNNTYYRLTPHPSGHDFSTIDTNGTVVYYSIAQWQALGYDVNSTFVEGLPETNQVFCEQSTFDAERGTVTIYNWQGLDDVAVDLSSFDLTSGNTYRLYNAMNPAEYHAFVSDGTDSAVSVPMTALDWTVAIPYGDTTALQAITAPDFMTFVLEPA